MKVKAFAPAKINLTLHVTGQRGDGYHTLDSVVMFADVGDWVTVEKAAETSLVVLGPTADGVPDDGRNLVVQAARLMGLSARITLEKNLPAEAGIGGGSADAAATVRALAALYDTEIPAISDLVSLGADVPVCMQAGWARMQGIGERITRLNQRQGWPMILVNPKVSVPTPTVFKALKEKNNTSMSDAIPLDLGPSDCVEWLTQQRNDLELPAVQEQPVIGQVLSELKQTDGCALGRMSGSGATCFGIYLSDADRDRALAKLRRAHPRWWVVSTTACSASLWGQTS